MQLSKHILYGACLIFLAAGCDNTDFKKTKGGMPYKLYASKSGKKLENGKFVKAHVIQKVKDSVAFNTYEAFPVYFPVTASEQPYDMSELYTQLKEGDSVYAVQMMDTFIKRSPMITEQTPFRNGDKVTISFKVLKVFDTAEEYRKDQEQVHNTRLQSEEAAIKEYLTKNNITAQRTGTGTYVQVIQQGTGAPVVPGKYVTVKYKGQTFNGKMFDTNVDSATGHVEPMGFTVGAQQMIKGFDEGVQVLRQGGRGRFFIPSMLGYGPMPRSEDLKAFTNLIFDVEILQVLDKAPQAPVVQNPGEMPPRGH